MEFTRKDLHNKFLPASILNTSANISPNYMYYGKKTIISNSFYRIKCLESPTLSFPSDTYYEPCILQNFLTSFSRFPFFVPYLPPIFLQYSMRDQFHVLTTLRPWWYLDQSMRDQGTPKQNKPIINQSTQSIWLICNSISLLHLNNLKDSHAHREKLWIHLCCLYFVKWCLQWLLLFATQGMLVKNHDVSTMIWKNTKNHRSNR